MLTGNSFAELPALLPPLLIQACIVLMIIAVTVGTPVGRLHQGGTKI